MLVAYAQLSGKDREIKSGEYDLSAAMTPLEILEKIVQGAVKMHEVTLPEGLRLDEVAARFGDAGITDPDAFLAQARDPEFARRLGLPTRVVRGLRLPRDLPLPPPHAARRGARAHARGVPQPASRPRISRRSRSPASRYTSS